LPDARILVFGRDAILGHLQNPMSGLKGMKFFGFLFLQSVNPAYSLGGLADLENAPSNVAPPAENEWKSGLGLGES